MPKHFGAAFLVSLALLSGCRTARYSARTEFSRFVGAENFSSFTRTQNERGETVLLSPEIKSGIPWNEMIVS